jgi:hypothetical protein
MSFQMRIKSHRLAGALFVTEVRDALLGMLIKKKKDEKLKQADIARILEVDRSVVNRQLTGKADLSLMRVGELADILGFVAEIKFVSKIPEHGNLRALGDTIIDYTSGQLKQHSAAVGNSYPSGAQESGLSRLSPKKRSLSPQYNPETLEANV